MDNPAAGGLTRRFAQWVTDHAKLIVLLWVVLALLVRVGAPSWQSLALDGDFDYLPADRPSVAAERLLDAAFPVARPRSQVVLVLGRQAAAFDDADELVSLDLLRRLHHRLAEVLIRRADRPTPTATDRPAAWQGELLTRARESLDEAIRIDEQYFERLQANDHGAAMPTESIRLTLAYWDRANLLQRLGLTSEAGPDMQAALTLDPEIAQRALPLDSRELASWMSLLDLVSWNDAVLGDRLRQPQARLILLRSDREFAAMHNIDFLEAIQEEIAASRIRHRAWLRPGFEVLATGSAAIGGATLTAAREAIRYTESFTVLIILVILVLVYRSPLLIAVPLVSIGLAVAVSTGVITWLTFGSEAGWLAGWDWRIFTTSRIFLFVILFGAGTDYCLFLIARVREEASQWPWDVAVTRALSGVSSALLGSALTTVVGLGMLSIAQFGKYQHTGPMIAVGLLIGLLVCLTFTPAVLRLLGPVVFWPLRVRDQLNSQPTDHSRFGGPPPTGIWGLIALRLTARPGLALVIGCGLLLLPAAYGWSHEDDVTYDISSQLPAAAESRRGLLMLDQHFGIGEVNPVTLLLLREQPVSEKQLREDAQNLALRLYSVDGVRAVRFANDPLGDFPPDRSMGLFSRDAWKRRALRTHPISRNHFFSTEPAFVGRLVRLDIVLRGNPFDVDTARRVTAMGDWLAREAASSDSPFAGAEVLLAGTTPSIIDLRAVTLSDHRRIKWAVVVSVFLVLLVVIRRAVLCGYLIATVLLSYYATLGLTVMFFKFAYGENYVGLDWKLPLFLFVILVAVGQDYNVYLVTRILEEQRQRRGWLSALRQALAKTGGIITACGLVMAGTFFSMTSAAWFPAIKQIVSGQPVDTAQGLRGIVELGFALGLGVLLDTFYVRTILVPSFVALLDRLRAAQR